MTIVVGREDCLENFSRKFSSTVGLLVSNCGTFAENFLENFVLASLKNLRKLRTIYYKL